MVLGRLYLQQIEIVSDSILKLAAAELWTKLLSCLTLWLTSSFFIHTYREEKFDPADFPPSYKDNLPKELLVLQYADNFRRQYVHLYRDRKPLFLNPVNECLVEVCLTFKFVSLCAYLFVCLLLLLLLFFFFFKIVTVGKSSFLCVFMT